DPHPGPPPRAGEGARPCGATGRQHVRCLLSTSTASAHQRRAPVERGRAAVELAAGGGEAAHVRCTPSRSVARPLPPPAGEGGDGGRSVVRCPAIPRPAGPPPRPSPARGGGS